MTEVNVKLILEPIHQSSSFVGSRGEAHGTTAVIYQQGNQQSAVTQIHEYDKRPFYDAWEYSSIKQVKLFQHHQALWVWLKIEEDAEWINGPLFSYQHYKSDDQGKSWQQSNSYEWSLIEESATLLLSSAGHPR